MKRCGILLQGQWQAVRKPLLEAGKMGILAVEKHLVKLLPVVTWNVPKGKKFEV